MKRIALVFHALLFFVLLAACVITFGYAGVLFWKLASLDIIVLFPCLLCFGLAVLSVYGIVDLVRSVFFKKDQQE